MTERTYTAAEVAAVRAEARRKALEEAAASQDCACSERPAVLAAWAHPHDRVARWKACSQTNCSAIVAAEIRALIEEPSDAG